jgi:signal transduction histidine kinase
MKRFLQSFYGKLSLVFLFLLIILGAMQILLTMQSATDYISKVDQQLNLTLARDMSSELESAISDTMDFEEIGHRIHYMMVMNPKVEIYVLDDQGKILAFFAEPGKEVKLEHVDLKPVKKFVDSTDELPILGDDPRGSGRLKPFSASGMPLGKLGQGYLYIVIGGKDYDSIATILRDNYVFATIMRGMLMSVAVAGVLGLILFFFLTRRIRSMSATVKQFEAGDYHERIPRPSTDEIGQLGSTFNQMADTIVANIEELKQTDDLRRELVANVSHDLRTPLASIQGYVETILMKEKTISHADRRKYLDIILQDTNKLARLVHELFDLSKLEAKQIQPNLELFSLTELVQDVAQKFQDKANRSLIKLDAPIVEGLPQINGDIALIERALTNLIDNALDYTPEQGAVKIELERHNGVIQVSVQDTGVGIAQKDIPHIFDRFYRGGTQKSKNKTSTGLGLAIAQKIVELHDSAIHVESQEGKGTRFSFELNI